MTQGGLEVKCQVTATWDNDKGRKILTQSIERNYKFSNSLIDDSEEILRSLLPTGNEIEPEHDLDDDMIGLELWDESGEETGDEDN